MFVIYSTEDSSDPTILYERKGVEAKAELDILFERMEDIENGRSIVEISKNINTLLGGDWLQEKHNMAHNDDRLGKRGSDIGHAPILQGKSSEFIGSPAFRNVVENLFEIQERTLISEEVGITADDEFLKADYSTCATSRLWFCLIKTIQFIER